MKFVYVTSLVAVGLTAGCSSGPNGGSLISPTPFDPGGSTTAGTGGTGFFGLFTDPIIVADSPPPPISGGTLTLIAQGHKAAVADPDHDQVVFVDLDLLKVSTTVALQPGDEPGRVVEDAAGRIHVSLRSGGSLVTLDASTGTVVARRAACQYPRGLAYDAKTDVVHVACAGGELVTFPAAGGDATRKVVLDHDLRDVVIDGDRLLVSRFHAAQLLVVEPDGKVSARLTPPGLTRQNFDSSGEPTKSTPAVAWRTIANPDGGALMVFQEDQTTEVRTEVGGYGGFGCGGGIVGTAVALLRADGQGWTTTDLQSVLPVDIALAPGGSLIGVARAGVVPTSSFSNGQPVITFEPRSLIRTNDDLNSGPCGGGKVSIEGTTGATTGTGTFGGMGGFAGGGGSSGDIGQQLPGAGQAVALAYDATGRLIVQTREPYTLQVGDRAIPLPGSSRKDTGHDLFHTGTQGGLACASCHPEGREDGHVWKFADFGERRTQAIGGGIKGTEPFHWSGDMNDFTTLSHEVFSKRMSGPELSDGHVNALVNWIDKIPAWKPAVPADLTAVDRGRALFNSAEVGCASCHTGDKMTNNTTVDVGTGAKFQVPSLRGVAFRAPFMHQGCAKTLDDRFNPACGGGDQHGKTSGLTAGQRTDLASFLSSL